MAKKTKAELFGKHPLAKAIEPVIKEWSNNDYPAVNGKEISWVTRELFKWWFSDQAHEGEKFHICQKRALETIIYCYEILGVPLVEGLFNAFSSDLLEKENLKKSIADIKHPRFGIKMGTGTGKTWVMTALVVWQCLNRVKLNDKRFSAHFLLCAPGNIVYDRLLDSFLGKKNESGKRQPFTADINKELFMPEDLRAEFNLRVFKKEDLQEGSPITEVPFILITNWHQLMDSTKRRVNTLSEDIGIEMKSDTISLRVDRFMNFLTYNNDLIVINDEAHHVHNVSDAEQKRWQESVELLREQIHKNKEYVFAQFDFTATPFSIKGKRKEYFPHIIYDYGLVEAMREMLVKQIFIEKSNILTNKIDNLPDKEKLMITAYRDDANEPIELSEVQKHMIEVGLAKLKKLEEEFKKFKINKKPVMFVMGDQNKEADLITDYIKKKIDPNWDGEDGGSHANKEVITIHEGKRNQLSDEDYIKLKDKVFTSDDPNNPVRVIVSVLMLREGFDVKNVAVMVVLRRSDSDLLTEQVIGRGIRLMFPEPEYLADKIENYNRIKDKQPLINSYDLLFVVEHPKYNEIYEQLTEAGAIIASGNSIEVDLDSKSVLVSIDESRIEDCDLSWPLHFGYRTEENIDFSYFDISQLKSYPTPLEEVEPTKIIITDYHPDTKYRKEWELEESNFSYEMFLRNVVKEVIGVSRRNVWLSRYSADIAAIVDEYISENLFGKVVEFNEENVKRLRNQQLFEFVVNNVRENLMKFIQNLKSKDKIEAEWVKLSNFKDMKMRMERAIETKKCLYPFVDFPYKGGFERRFTEDVLENDSMVESYVKLNQYIHRFSIPYINTMGHLVPYYPDFIVKTKNFMLVVETKSEKDAKNDLDVKRKALAAEKRCKEISKIETDPPTLQPKQWKYILLPENLHKELEGAGLRTFIQRCDSFLALLKMKQE